MVFHEDARWQFGPHTIGKDKVEELPIRLDTHKSHALENLRRQAVKVFDLGKFKELGLWMFSTICRSLLNADVWLKLWCFHHNRFLGHQRLR